jgi:Uma2 family endonuclease
MGMYGAANDYRVPDVVIYPPEALAERGLDGAPLVVFEIRSPNDESYEKLPWYLARGTGAVVIIDPPRLSVEAFTTDGQVDPDADGLVPIPGLGVRLGGTRDDEAVIIETEGGIHRIEV